MSLRPNYDFLGLAPAAPAPDSHVEIAPETGAMLLHDGAAAEVKYVPFSPIEEFAVREGETETLEEEFHAVLCHGYRGSGTVTAKGIRIKDAQLVGHAHTKLGVLYWSPDSPLCNRVADGPLKVYYTYSPARPEIVHIWDLSWKYLGSLPEAERVPILDPSALAAAGKEKARQIKVFTDEMQRLHADESVREINDASHNAAAMGRVAIAMDLPAESVPRPRSESPAAAPSGFDRAGRDAEALVETVRHTRDLRSAVDRDLVEIAANRREAAPAAHAYDPLDDL